MSQFVYGKNVIKQILTSPDVILEVYLASEDKEVLKVCRENKIPCHILSKKELSKLSKSKHHQGYVVKRKDYPTYPLEELIAQKKSEHGLLILLDEMEDPHNLGAILRTADAIGADGVIFKKNHAVGLTPTVAKVSAGAIDRVKCAEVTNLTQTANKLKEAGYWILGADMDGQDYRTLDYDFHVVLVIGNEGKGISRLLRETCDYIISLPMVGEMESLNASVSAGILLYEINNKRFPI
ncbi:MAG: 23S rRNA (guanosine(2251)-2'-O)-methyltransferase RlmB [Solobacterium sp.]|nr:23S rRNA (guanosine(2251)-2'-O)-methyltransferase RlmB [Solobacterium sp.]